MKHLMIMALILQMGCSILILEPRNKTWRKLRLSLGIFFTALLSLLLSSSCTPKKRIDPDEHVDYGPPPDYEEAEPAPETPTDVNLESIVAYGPPEVFNPPPKPNDRPKDGAKDKSCLNAPAKPDSLKPSSQTDPPPEAPESDVCYGPPGGF